jgi:hypothetical protein
MIRRIALSIVLAAALAAPSAALAHRGGDDERFGSPFAAAGIEGDGVQTEDTAQPEVTKPAGEETTTTTAEPDPEPTERPKRERPGRDDFGAAFLRRVWRFNVEADGYDAENHVLSATVVRVLGGAPRRARRALVDVSANVLVTATTRIIDGDGHRVTGDAIATALDDADLAQVTGKLLPRSSWQNDEDGEPVPTVRAKRIRVRS